MINLGHSAKVGISFGLNSGVITTLGLIVGLYSGTQSFLAVVGGIITIAIADAFSDSLGIHISEEFEGVHTPKEVWISTIATFLTKFFVALTFLIPILIFPLKLAVMLSVLWGFALIVGFSWKLEKEQKTQGVIKEHIIFAIVVIATTYYVGHLIDFLFGTA